MRGCDPDSAAAKLQTAIEALNRAWADAAAQWEDPMSRTFEKEFLAPLESKVKRALDAIRHLTEAVSNAERECGE
jgi:hypothetical protein